MKNRFPAHILFGSNIEPEVNLRRAVARLRDRVEILAGSRVFSSPPVGTDEGGAFLNAAVRISTDLAPAALKYQVLRRIEDALGRRRTADKNAPRTIDLDIAWFGELVLDQHRPRVVLPDPDLLVHAHAIQPLADLDPETRHPETGETFDTLAQRLAAGADLTPVADDLLRF